MFHNRVLMCNQQWNDNNVHNNEMNGNCDIISLLSKYFFQLCSDKFGSNIAELCYQYANETQRNLIIEQLLMSCNENDDNSDKSCYNPVYNKHKKFQIENEMMLISLIKHEYGNYVVQKIIMLSNEQQKHMLLNAIKKNLSYLKNQLYRYPCIKRFVKNFFMKSRHGTK